jgi:hypothetical protein
MVSWLCGGRMLVSLALCFACAPLWAARISDVAGTAHNLSVSGPGPVKALTETQICVFCHTPHGAEPIAAPLWNRELSGATYTPYTSSSINASDIAATPGGSSKLCLSCHDGTLAIGAVNVANGQVNPTISMTGTGPGGTIHEGAGAQTGFTRDLGVNLTNDHPISFTYNSALATADGELRDPSLEPYIGNPSPGVRFVVPLEVDKLECSSCHDPHIRHTNVNLNIKFLRLNRFQVVNPGGGAFSEGNDQVCIACHDKLGQAWARSAHADETVADEIYKDAAASLREFPTSTPGPAIKVWQAACLNCHDSHTVEGARRLLREGTDSGPSPKFGGASAIEETCYQCHSNAAESILLNVTQVPDIKTDFLLLRHMPIATSDQQSTLEAHDVTDADGSESQLLLGKGDLNNRHAECTDCHNPHRVLKNQLFNGAGTTVAGTHPHGSGHTNIASGTLRGAWGVEPVYGSASFHVLPSNYFVKSGDGGLGASTAAVAPYVTREYQVCIKCHSDFGYNDNNNYPTGNRPDLGDSGGGTTPGTNGLTQYTNQAREFQAPINHKGQTSTSDSCAGSGFSVNNHRSWHPVIGDTGRTAGVRNMSGSTNLFLAPWEGANIGTQTMYCSDCHGTNTANGTVVPAGGEDGSPWGPHGSTNDFILKGPWDSTTGINNNGLCFRCHSHTNYATDVNRGDRAGFESGFGGPDDTNLHAFHADRLGQNLRCMWCHVAVPHGWKNKALLVNLNDVGPEAGLGAGTEISIGSNPDVYNQEPYYLNAKLKVRTFATSGNWQDTNCGSAGSTAPGNDDQFGRDWMRAVCDNPP